MTVGATVRITGTGADQLAQGFARLEKKVDRLGKTGRRSGQQLSQGFSRARGKATALYAALGGAGIIAGTKKVLDYRQAMGQLQADMGINTAAAKKLSDQVLDLSVKHKLAKEKVMGALTVFQDFGGIVGKGTVILDGLAKVSKASGTDMSELATIASTLMQTLGMSPKAALQAVTQFNDQALKGQIAMRKLAKIIPEVMGAGVGKGFTGQRAITQLGTLLQVAGQATGGKAEEARTQALALMRDLKAKSKQLARKGIRVLDKKGNLKDIDVIMAALLKKTKGSMQLGGKDIFSEESNKVAGIYKSMFDQKSGKFKKGSTVSKVLGAKGGMAAIDKQYKLRTEGIAKEAEKVEEGLRKLDRALQKFGGKAVEAVAANPMKYAASAAGGYAAVKFGPSVIKGLISMVQRRRGKGGGGLGDIAGAAVQRVFVTNWQGSGGNVSGGAPGSGMSKFEKAGAVVAVAALAYGIGTAIDQATGASDAISSGLTKKGGMFETGHMKALRSAEQTRLTSTGQKTAMEEAIAKAKKFSGMAARGVAVTGAGGQKRAIDQAFIVKQMAQVLAGSFSKDQVAKMNGLLAQIAAKQLIVAVKPAGGVDRINAQAGRGASQ